MKLVANFAFAFLALLALLALFSSVALSLPLDDVAKDAAAGSGALARAGGGVYMCRNKLFSDTRGCEWLDIKAHQNHCLPLRCDLGITCQYTGMEGVWMSFGPDRGVGCTLYASNTCQTSMRHNKIEWPGTGDLEGWSRMETRGAGGQPITYTAFSCRYV